MKKILFTLLITSAFSLPLHAQWKNATRGLHIQAKRLQQYALQQFRTKTNRLKHQIIQPVGVTQHEVERAVFQARSTTPSRLTLEASKALIPLRERDHTMRYFRVKGTAFAVEETYQGEKYIWGVTATHYKYQFPAIPKKRFSYERFSFLAQGNARANDVSIFQIPESLAGTFKPLKLADHAPEVGDRLFSLSFFDNRFQYTPGRKVLETSPGRFTTSLRIEPGMDREGECGSPILNYNGEVVGMVVGASYTRKIGFAVPVENIRKLIQAYHQREAGLSPVLANGKEIFQLDVTDAIESITVKQLDNSIVQKFTYRKNLDYTHLEDFVDLSQAREIIVTVEQAPFSNEGGYLKPITKQVTYNLETQQITTSIVP